jgi:tRNA 2-thiouridine synthesizing protein A
MKDAVENNEIILDTSGTECPIPVLKARKLSESLIDGSIVKIICTDPLAEADFKHFCEQSGHSFIDCTKKNEVIYIRFKFKKN